jgi:plasmid maintenance system killer protein
MKTTIRVACARTKSNGSSACSSISTALREPNDMNLPGWRLHPLKGELAGFWSVTVTANWRIIWRFEGRDVTDVDYVDYH